MKIVFNNEQEKKRFEKYLQELDSIAIEYHKSGRETTQVELKGWLNQSFLSSAIKPGEFVFLQDVIPFSKFLKSMDKEVAEQ